MGLFLLGKNTFELSVMSYVDEIINSNVKIPTFQRGYVWRGKPTKVTALLESINLGFNLGTTVFWESKINLERKIDNFDNSKDKDGYFQYIIDGQQRSLTLASLFSQRNFVDIDKTNIFIYLIDGTLEFTHNKKARSLGMDLDIFVKEILYSQQGKFDFNKKYKRDFNENDIELFEELIYLFKRKLSSEKIIIGYKLHVSTTDLSLAISQFEKINSAGIKLNEFEILNAMAFTDKNYMLSEQSKDNEFGKVENVVKKNTAKDFTNDSKKIILNSYKLIKNYEELDKKGQHIISLSANAISKFREGDSAILKSIINLYKEFLSEIHEMNIKSLNDVPYNPNVTLYIFIKYIMTEELMSNISDREFIYKVMVQTGLQRSYDKSSSQTMIKHIRLVKGQIEAQLPIKIKDDSNFEISQSDVLNTNYNSLKAFEKAIFIYWTVNYDGTKQNLDYKNDSPVKMNGIFKKSKNIDHIFPKSEYKSPLKREHTIANLAIVTSDTNKKKSNMIPSKYFGDMNYESKSKMFKSHFITKELHYKLINDEFERFVNERAHEISVDLNEMFDVL